jgi:hypothetical protein
MKTNIKNTIKQLSKEVEDVLNKNEISNEMSALIDYGEWSGTNPDFSKLIEKWKLTRPQLEAYVNIAESYCKKWFESYPKEIRAKLPGEEMSSFEYRNPWYIIYTNLNCIFMANEL